MNDQLILKFPSKKAYLKEDFYVSESNEKAYDFVNAWPKWIKKYLIYMDLPVPAKHT